MITSVTNFAGSVSRNMDRLSLDTSHMERQEENRRSRPGSVTEGISQGLTGFGLSLLGELMFRFLFLNFHSNNYKTLCG